MTISYPLTMPTTPGARIVNFHAVNSVGLVRSPYTYRTQVQNFKAGTWGAEITLPEMTEETVAEWQAFLVALRGVYGTFYLGDPARKVPRGLAIGTPLVKGANQLGNSLLIDGTGDTTVNWYRAGDKFQMANRLYMCLKDVTSDSSGNIAMDVWPEIITSPPDNEPIITNDPKGIFRLAENAVPIHSVDESHTYSVALTAVEAL